MLTPLQSRQKRTTERPREIRHWQLSHWGRHPLHYPAWGWRSCGSPKCLTTRTFSWWGCSNRSLKLDRLGIFSSRYTNYYKVIIIASCNGARGIIALSVTPLDSVYHTIRSQVQYNCLHLYLLCVHLRLWISWISSLINVRPQNN